MDQVLLPCRKRARRMGIQRLYNVCKATFSSSSSRVSTPPKLLQLVAAVVDSMTCWDFGLDEQGMLNSGLSLESVKCTPTISYLPIYESCDFSIGIFCLPASSKIPLHNHPGMTVFTKLLCGTMHYKAYDWADTQESLSQHARLAKLVLDETRSAPCQASILFPDHGGNIHALTAITTCAILDVLAPPYSTRTGRHCSYYTESSTIQRNIPELINGDTTYSWLEECDANCNILSATYKGPRFHL